MHVGDLPTPSRGAGVPSVREGPAHAHARAPLFGEARKSGLKPALAGLAEQGCPQRRVRVRGGTLGRMERRRRVRGWAGLQRRCREQFVSALLSAPAGLARVPECLGRRIAGEIAPEQVSEQLSVVRELVGSQSSRRSVTTLAPKAVRVIRYVRVLGEMIATASRPSRTLVPRRRRLSPRLLRGVPRAPAGSAPGQALRTRPGPRHRGQRLRRRAYGLPPHRSPVPPRLPRGPPDNEPATGCPQASV